MKVLITMLLLISAVLSYSFIKQKRHDAFLVKEKIRIDSVTADHFMRCKKVKEDEYLSVVLDTNDIVFLGSSITEAFPLTYLSNNIHIKNFAVAGSLITDVDYMATHIVDKHPRKIFIEIGINDIRYSFDRPDMEQNFKDHLNKIFYQIRTYSPQTKIYIHSILPIATADYPSNTHAVNAAIAKLNAFIANTASKIGGVYINTYDLFQVDGALPANLSADGIHITNKVYQKWYTQLQQYLD